MSFIDLVFTLLHVFLHYSTSLVKGLLWIAWIPFGLLYYTTLYVLYNGWLLALLIAGISCGLVLYKYNKRKRDNDNNTPTHLINFPAIVDEIFPTLPVLPTNGWSLESVSQGVRVFTRFFPSLSGHSPNSCTLIGASTFLDSKAKNAFKYLHDPSDLPSWFGRVHGRVQVTSSRGQTTPPPSLHSDTVAMTIKRNDDVWAWFYFKRAWHIIKEHLPYSNNDNNNEYHYESLARTWCSNEEISYIFTSPQTTPTSFPFQWALAIIVPVPQQKQFSVLTLLLLPTSPSLLPSSIDIVSNQITSFRNHVLLKECNAPNISYIRRVGGANVSRTIPISVTMATSRATPNSVTVATPRATPTTQSNVVHSDVPNGCGPVAPSNNTLSEADVRYIRLAIQNAENLLQTANASIEDGWSLVSNSKGIKIMKKAAGRGEPPINSVKGTTNINCPPEFLLRILMDPSHSKELDDMLDSMTLVSPIADHVHLMHLKYKAIWPTTGRDFCVLNIFGQLDKDTWIHSAASIVDGRVPESKNYVRAEVLSGGYVIKACPGQQGVSKVTYVAQVDLKGNVPTFIVNKICESQPQCVSHFKSLAESEFGRLNRNLIKMKQFEEQFVIPRISEEMTTPPRTTPTSSLTSNRNASLNDLPSLALPSSLVTTTTSLPTLDTSLNETTPPNELEETFTAEEVSEDERDERRTVEEERGDIEVSLSKTDTFNPHTVPSLPIANVLDRLPRYRSDSTESDESAPPLSVTSLSSALIDYPRTEEGIDYRTMGNQNAAKLLEEMFHISELDLMNQSTFRDQSNGWKYQGIEKDVVILKKKKHNDSPYHSFIGKGLIDLSPQEVYNCVRNPNQRYVFDNMLKELHVVKQIEADLYILHMQHETNQCFLRQSRDFCVLVCERSEPNKKIIVGASIEVPECPPQANCTRGKVMTSGWVIEPYRYKEKLMTQITYLVQVDMGGVPAALVNFVSRRQPLAVAYLRDYLETTSLNSNRNGRDMRPSLLSGDPPSDLTMMFIK